MAIQKGRWALVEIGTHKPVSKGDNVKDFRGQWNVVRDGESKPVEEECVGRGKAGTVPLGKA